MITVLNEGTVVLFTPATAKDRRFLEEQLATEPWQWLGGGVAVAVDHRYANDIINLGLDWGVRFALRRI